MNFKKAELIDLDLYFNWVSDESVRQNSISRKEIDYEEHSVWFKNKLKSPSSFLYVFFINNNPIGQVRFDLIKLNAEIDYSIDSDYRGKGLGKKMLEFAIEIFKEEIDITLVARVDKDNVASNKIFEKLKFNLVRHEKDESRIINVYNLKNSC